GQLGGDEAPTEACALVAQYLDIVLIAPGGEETTHRRVLFDRRPAEARESGSGDLLEERVVLDGVMSSYVLLVTGGALSAGFVAAGDHALEVRSPGGARETGYYQLRLTQLGPLYAPPAAADADAGAGGDVASGAAGPTAVVVSLALADGAAAAYWHEGQRLQGVATVENRGGEAVEVVVAAAASDARVEASVVGP